MTTKLFTPPQIGQKIGHQVPAHRRHIVIDNVRKVITVEVKQHPATRNFEKDAFQKIKRGDWAEFVPKEFGQQIGHALANGYTIEPVMCIGHESEEYRIIQLVELREKAIINDGN